MNDNKLIAEFMGHKTDWGFKKDSILYMPQGEGNSTNNSVVIPYKKLRYHTSWDWLMPVLRNISDTAKLYELPEDSNLIEDITNGLVSIDIEMTFEAVVEFIKEFNQTHTL